MGACLIILCEDVEEEGLHIKVQGFVVKEQLSQQTQVLAVEFAGVAVHFKDWQGLVPVDFISWRVE